MAERRGAARPSGGWRGIPRASWWGGIAGVLLMLAPSDAIAQQSRTKAKPKTPAAAPASATATRSRRATPASRPAVRSKTPPRTISASRTTGRSSAAATPALPKVPAVKIAPVPSTGNPTKDLAAVRAQRAHLERQATTLARTSTQLARAVKALDAQATTLGKTVQSIASRLTTVVREVSVTEDALQGARRRQAARAAAARAHRHAAVVAASRRPRGPGAGALRVRSHDTYVLDQLLRADARRVQHATREATTIASTHATLRAREDSLAAARRVAATTQTTIAKQAASTRAVLKVAERTKAQVQAQLTKLRAAERQLVSAIAALEAKRKAREAAMAPGARAKSTLTTKDLGALAWPVDGAVLYPFGREVQANRTTIRWNGIGIAAAEGTPVRAVAAGTVVHVGKMGTYGLTLIVDHGAGDYSVYGSLATARVATGTVVTKGMALGTVGRADPDLPPHLHFEIRRGGPAVDPAGWLRARQ